MPKSRGFTLIELLVAISIIAIMSAVGLTSYTTFIKNSRDARRQSDLKFIQSALEQYHGDQKFYPDYIVSEGQMTSPDGTKTYLTTVPKDPKDKSDYSYGGTNCGSNGRCTGYCLSAALEGVNLSDECTPAEGFNYGVTRP